MCMPVIFQRPQIVLLYIYQHIVCSAISALFAMKQSHIGIATIVEKSGCVLEMVVMSVGTRSLLKSATVMCDG